METKSVEDRLAVLEAEVRRLGQLVEKEKIPWWKEWAGAFLDDPCFKEAMEHGKRYRESLRRNLRLVEVHHGKSKR